VARIGWKVVPADFKGGLSTTIPTSASGSADKQSRMRAVQEAPIALTRQDSSIMPELLRVETAAMWGHRGDGLYPTLNNRECRDCPVEELESCEH
jgi:hypothetical protein